MESHILIAASTPMETGGIKRELASVQTILTGRRTIIAGSIDKLSVRLIETGPGIVNAAHSLTAAIESRIPEMILMIGCAGGFARAGLGIGDIAIASEENDTHLGIEPESDDEPLQPLPFNLGVFNGIGVKHHIATDPHLVSTARDTLAAAFSDLPINIQTGPFITVSTITATDQRAERLFERFHPSMENMEGFAGAYISKHYNIPFLEIRCASNLVGKRNRSSWDLDIACERSAKAAIAWLRR